MKTIHNIISSKKINGTCIIRFPGINKINTINSNKIESELLELLENQYSRIVLDLQEIEFIDSTGFGLLLNLKKKTSYRNIDLILMYINSEVMELFALLGLEHEFGIRRTSLKEAC